MSLLASIEQMFEAKSPAIVAAVRPLIDDAVTSLETRIEASLASKFAALEEKLLGTSAAAPIAAESVAPAAEAL